MTGENDNFNLKITQLKLKKDSCVLSLSLFAVGRKLKKYPNNLRTKKHVKITLSVPVISGYLQCDVIFLSSTIPRKIAFNLEFNFNIDCGLEWYENINLPLIKIVINLN